MLDRVEAGTIETFSTRKLLSHYADVRKRLMQGPRTPTLTLVPPAEPEERSTPDEVPAAQCDEPGEALPAEVLAHVVHVCAGNEGLLDHAMKWLLVFNKLNPGALTIEVVEAEIVRAQEALKNPRRISIDAVVKATAERFGVSRADILSQRRTADVVRPRQVAMYLAKTLTLRSFPEIGRRMGGRDHTTVLHGVRKIEQLAAQSPTLADEIAAIRAGLEAGR
jgi:chromosomal replication initiator protein